MGTNYYIKPNKECHFCRCFGEELHIGRSSNGWCFALRVYPDRDINNLNAWKELLKLYSSSIYDEYGDPITFEGLIHMIEDRRGGIKFDEPYIENMLDSYSSWYEFHAGNNSAPSSYGLLRRRLGGIVVAHGEGPWDLLEGNFS